MARCILCEAQAVDMHFFICPGSEKSARGISKFEIAAAGPSHCEYTLIEERSTSPTDLSLLLLFVTCGQLCDDAAIVCFAGAMVHSPSGCASRTRCLRMLRPSQRPSSSSRLQSGAAPGDGRSVPVPRHRDAENRETSQKVARTSAERSPCARSPVSALRLEASWSSILDVHPPKPGTSGFFVLV